MLAKLLLPDLAGLALSNITVDKQTIVLEIQIVTSQAPCPTCGVVSDRVHSRYTRHPQDLAWAALSVRWHLRVRRFRCLNPVCPQQLFAERLPDILPPDARRTERLTEALRQLALTAGALAASRLSTKLGGSSSASTLLRILRSTNLPESEAPKVVGLDEWAWRKGRTYGTIMVDLEAHRVLDLLPDCRSESVAEWLQRYPSITVISRDRSGPFASAAAQGAPQATQVADRFHLLKNLTETLQRVFDQHRSQLDAVRAAVNQPAAAPASEPATTARPSAAAQRAERQVQRQARYQELRQLHASGMTRAQIAARVGLSRKTVSRWLNTTAYPAHPGAKRRGRPYGSQLDPFKPYLLERFQAGCHNARLLYEEIRTQGFAGCSSLVRKFLTVIRRCLGQGTPVPIQTTPRYSIADLVFCVLRRPKDMTEEHQALIARIEASDEVVRTACQLAQTFAVMVRERRAEDLQAGLEQADTSGIAAFRTFVAGLRRDEAAVRAGLELPWSQGQTEGQIHRLKLIKRAGYGRASFELLRQRVVAAA
jgi:transposase